MLFLNLVIYFFPHSAIAYLLPLTLSPSACVCVCVRFFRFVSIYRFDENAVLVELNVHKNAEAENQLMAELKANEHTNLMWRAHTIFRNCKHTHMHSVYFEERQRRTNKMRTSLHIWEQAIHSSQRASKHKRTHKAMHCYVIHLLMRKYALSCCHWRRHLR